MMAFALGIFKGNTVSEIGWSMVILVVVSFFAIIYLSKRNVMKLKDENFPGTLGEHTITIDNGGIHEETLVNKHCHFWCSISLIKENGNYIYIFIGINPLIIPKRAFSTKEEEKEFFNMILLLWKQCGKVY